jgi:hypothetical protein
MQASKQAVVRFQIVKSYGTSKVASIPPVHSLRRNHAYDKFARYCNPKVWQIYADGYTTFSFGMDSVIIF